METTEQVETTELIRTSQSWEGAQLPDYLQGRPELVVANTSSPPDKNWAGTTIP